jgi:hypothetical protein
MPSHERHIEDEQMYRDAVRNLRWNNGKGQGERWKMDELVPRSGLDFNQEYFTPYDYSYAVNAHYADYGNLSEKPDYYMQMAKDYLRNDSYPERGGERAYYDAEMRSRRYNYGNTYENYNRYDNYNNRRYAERNSYGDRDNDGRYYE